MKIFVSEVGFLWWFEDEFSGDVSMNRRENRGLVFLRSLKSEKKIKKIAFILLAKW